MGKYGDISQAPFTRGETAATFCICWEGRARRFATVRTEGVTKRKESVPQNHGRRKCNDVRKYSECTSK